MRFLKQYCTILFPVFLILGMCIIRPLLPDKTFSKVEMRYLAQPPQFNLEHMLAGVYSKKFESYYSDQFPMRNFWLYMDDSINIVIGKKSSDVTNGV